MTTRDERARPNPNASGRNAHANEARGTGFGSGPESNEVKTHLIWRVYVAFQQDRVLLIAAGVTYFGLLALFPALAALVSLFGLFANPQSITDEMTTLEGVVPGGAIAVIKEQIGRIQAQSGGTLGAFFIGGLLISLWSANAGVKSVFDALNAVHRSPERRSFVQYNLQALMFTLGGILFIILAIGAIVVVPAVFAYVGLGNATKWIVSVVRWPLLLLITIVALALLYRFGPTREGAHWRWITWGSAIAAVTWIAGSMLFSWYVSNFGTFNRTYGSLGAVIGFMIWMWLSATILLLGAEIDAELERPREPANPPPQA